VQREKHRQSFEIGVGKARPQLQSLSLITCSLATWQGACLLQESGVYISLNTLTYSYSQSHFSSVVARSLYFVGNEVQSCDLNKPDSPRWQTLREMF
jgi:hypothetical protein